MDETPNLRLPYILPSQAQKHVTHNEAIRRLDAVVQLSVLQRNLTSPPASPADGSRYLVAAAATGAWSGGDGMVAAWQDGAWAFFEPEAGWLLWIQDEQRLCAFDGAVWVDAALNGINPIALVGVNTTADPTNRLAVKSAASLFDNQSGDHQLKINKALAANTGSLLLQTGYSGRAELGLAGDDDWHLKVSSDGTSWVEALKVDAATGRVRMPAGLALSDDNQLVARRHIREILFASRTYYVRTDGSDSNTGLTNTAGGAFLTVQKAIDVALTLDTSLYAVTISIGAGTFAQNLTINGNGNARLILSGAGHASTTIGAGTGTQVTANYGVRVTLQNLKLADGGSVCIWVRYGATTFITGSVALGSATARQIGVDLGGYLEASGATIHLAGDAPVFLLASDYGAMTMTSTATIATTAARTYSGAVARATTGKIIFGGSVTWNETSGAISGKRYDASVNGVISVSGGTIPGTLAGTTATGGQYV